jgi:integrase
MKWQLIGSHVCRRSFASNLYGTLPTPLIMQITAHSSEKMLQNYIGKQGLDYAQQIADFYTLQALKEQRQPQLNVIKNASNQ